MTDLGNSAVQAVAGPGGAAFAFQFGLNNTAEQQVGGDDNRAEIAQISTDTAWSQLAQVDAGARTADPRIELAAFAPTFGNSARQVQDGRGNFARAVQIGRENVAFQRQDGAELTSLIFQSGQDNRADVRQSGMLNYAMVVQAGQGNGAAVSQAGQGAIALISQSGQGNFASIRQ